MRQRQRARGPHGSVEAGAARKARHSVLVLIEDHGQVVAWRVVELLHHQPAAPCRARPVDGAQRLAGGVLADGVDLEPRRPPEARASCSRLPGAVGREHRGENRDPGPYEELRPLVEPLLDPLEPEWIDEDDLGRLELVSSPRQVGERDHGARAAHPHRVLRDAEPLPERDRAADEPPPVPGSHLDDDVAALDAVAGQQPALEVDRVARRAGPDPSEKPGQDEAEPHDDGRSRSERPRRDEGRDPECDGAGASPSHTGTGVPSSASRTTSPGPSPAERASGASRILCESTGSAISRMSSGVTYSRRSTSARAFARRSRAMPERGLAPRARWRFARVCRRRATT